MHPTNCATTGTVYEINFKNASAFCGYLVYGTNHCAFFLWRKYKNGLKKQKSREPPLAPAWWLEGKLRQSRLKCIQNSAQRLVPCMR